MTCMTCMTRRTTRWCLTSPRTKRPTAAAQRKSQTRSCKSGRKMLGGGFMTHWMFYMQLGFCAKKASLCRVIPPYWRWLEWIEIIICPLNLQGVNQQWLTIYLMSRFVVALKRWSFRLSIKNRFVKRNVNFWEIASITSFATSTWSSVIWSLSNKVKSIPKAKRCISRLSWLQPKTAPIMRWSSHLERIEARWTLQWSNPLSA